MAANPSGGAPRGAGRAGHPPSQGSLGQKDLGISTTSPWCQGIWFCAWENQIVTQWWEKLPGRAWTPSRYSPGSPCLGRKTQNAPRCAPLVHHYLIKLSPVLRINPNHQFSEPSAPVAEPGFTTQKAHPALPLPQDIQMWVKCPHGKWLYEV